MTIILGVFFGISLAINGILVWYARKLITQIFYFTDEVSKLEEHFESFGTHLGGIYELEMFYGDETLDGLLSHSRDLLSRVSDFREGFSIELEEEENAAEEKNAEEES